MKFRCERDSLYEALTTAGRAVSTRTTSPVLAGLLIEISGNDMVVVGTDLDMTIRVGIEAIGLDDGRCVAPARLVADIVRSMEPGAVTVESTEDDLAISAARSRFVVRTIPVGDYPVLSPPGGSSTTITSSGLLDALRQVIRAASTDDTRPLLTGILVAAEGDGIRMVATDSYRLAFRDIHGAHPLPEGTDQILIPARALTELQRLLPSMSGKADHDVGFAVGDLEATFTIKGVTVSTRLLEGKFPDYRQLVPPAYPNVLRAGKDSLLDALRRVRLLVRDNTTAVRLAMRPGGVELTVVTQEVGHASEDVDADFEGDELTVAFNPSYLIDGVEAVMGDEVVIETVDTSKPATVRSPTHDDYRYLLMPVRVS